MKKTNQAVIYCRKSLNENEVGKQENTLQDQMERAKAHCVSKGFEVAAILTDQVSAKVPLFDRPSGKKLAELVRNGQIQHVVCTKLDRLFRDTVDCLTTAQEFEKLGVGMHLIDNDINTAGPLGHFFISVLSATSCLERHLISERTKNGLSYLKAHGRVYSNTPFGFDAVDGKLVPNATEQKLLRRIKRLVTLGKSLQAIADLLNGEGVLTKTGKAWTRANLHYLLNKE